MTYTRREFGGLVAGGLVAARVHPARAVPQGSRIAGVRIGAQTYSFRDRNLDEAVAAMRTVGLSYCELWSGHVETREAIPVPAGGNRREATRAWRLDPATLDLFRDIRKRFEAAGVTVTSYDVPFRADFTDEEIARVFEFARTLGASAITSSTQVSLAARVAPFAGKAGMRVGFHNHSRIANDEVATTADLTEVLAAGPQMAVTLDIGHFTAANEDAVAFLDAHHDRIVGLHIKDRRRDQGPNQPLGEGDTPIAAVLTRLRDRKWDIPAHIEYEYRGQDTVEEVRRSLAYCRRILETT